MRGKVDSAIGRWLVMPGFTKLNNWVYHAEVAIAAADLAPPYDFFNVAAIGVSNIQRSNTFAPSPEKFILASINMLVKFPTDTPSNATAADVANMANAIRIIRGNLKLVLQASQGQTVLDVPCEALPAGPEPTGMISTGGVVASGGYGQQDAYPFYFPFEKETASVVQLVLNSAAALTTMTIPLACRVQIRFNGIRMLATGGGVPQLTQ